jgi:predicted CopG family antitoxin
MSLKHITVTEENYQHLKNLGKAGDSFNDVITKILNKIDTMPNESHGVRN